MHKFFALIWWLFLSFYFTNLLSFACQACEYDAKQTEVEQCQDSDGYKEPKAKRVAMKPANVSGSICRYKQDVICGKHFLSALAEAVITKQCTMAMVRVSNFSYNVFQYIDTPSIYNSKRWLSKVHTKLVMPQNIAKSSVLFTYLLYSFFGRCRKLRSHCLWPQLSKEYHMITQQRPAEWSLLNFASPQIIVTNLVQPFPNALIVDSSAKTNMSAHWLTHFFN